MLLATIIINEQSHVYSVKRLRKQIRLIQGYESSSVGAFMSTRACCRWAVVFVSPPHLADLPVVSMREVQVVRAVGLHGSVAVQGANPPEKLFGLGLRSRV